MKVKKFLPVICIIVLCFSIDAAVFAADRGKNVTLILGAFDDEVLMLQNQISERKEHSIEKIKFVSGKLMSRDVVICWTGIGKVNAAVTTTLALEHFKPSEVIFTGIAGGLNPDLLPGDIVIAERSVQHDTGKLTIDGMVNSGLQSAVENIKTPVFIEADKRLLKLTELAAKKVKLESFENQRESRKPKIITGTVATGDVFVASSLKAKEIRKRLGADAVEMEGAAVAQVCYLQCVPAIIIRSISDNANEAAEVDIEKFYKIAAKNSATLTKKIVELIGNSVKTENKDKKNIASGCKN